MICFGNLTWGGNGKTPMVEFLVRWFCHSGICPLILTRVLSLLLYPLLKQSSNICILRFVVIHSDSSELLHLVLVHLYMKAGGVACRH